jgi:predicted nucleotidyltransferase
MSSASGPTRTGVNDASFARALHLASEALESRGIPHLFMGGIASIVHGRTSWTHDIDVFIPAAHEPDAMQALVTEGFTALEPEHVWLSKAELGGVVVDLIHRAEGPVFVDEEMLTRAVRREVWGVPVKVMAPEDLIITKALAHGEETAHYWWDLLAIIAGCELDWDYLVHRARRGPRRILSVLFYAQSSDLTVPDAAVRRLLDSVVGPVVV